MARKVVGRVSREMNRGTFEESTNYNGRKTSAGAYIRPGRKVDAPPSQGIGPYYRDE